MVPDLFRVLNMISHDKITCSTREINLVFPSTHVFFCLCKGQSLKSDNFYRKAIIEKRQFSHVRLSVLSVLEISIKHFTLYNKVV